MLMQRQELPLYGTREQWLQAFIDAARQPFAAIGAPIPSNTRVAIGFTSHGARGRAIGQCWSDIASEDGNFEIFIHPKLSDPTDIAAVLTHELVHAAVGLDAKHGPIFKGAATALGLTGKMTATVPGEVWHMWADPMIAELGPLPHGALLTGQHTGRKKQKTALLKVECDTCGWLARVTSKHIDPYSYLRCPTGCGGELKQGE